MMGSNASLNVQRNMGKIRLIACLVVFLCHGIAAFQLSMVASRSSVPKSFDGSPSFPNPRSPNRSLQPNQSSSSPLNGVSSSLISNLAVVALKLRLNGQTGVACDVQVSSSDVLLKGQVGPVTVKGRGWQSRLGLSCRAIEATVDVCKLDMGRVISNQKLVLITPAEGTAMVALNSVDFGNFVTHPLMKPPGLPETEGNVDPGAQLEFLKEGATVDPSSGSVLFFGSYLGEKWEFKLQRGSNGKQADISVRPLASTDSINGMDTAKISEGLAVVTSKFFNAMVFELDGTFLSFRDMMVTGKGKEPSVMISLSILVRKFPSPGLEF